LQIEENEKQQDREQANTEEQTNLTNTLLNILPSAKEYLQTLISVENLKVGIPLKRPF
jgi:hypothetical protein